MSGVLEQLEKLIQAEYDIDCNHGIYNVLDHVLSIAAEAGHTCIVKYLLDERGLDENLDDEDDQTLELATRGGHLNLVKYLFERKGKHPNIHARGNAALRTATDFGQRATAQYLISKGADVSILKDWERERIGA